MLDHVATIVICSIIECGVGIVAGSLPSLRPLLNRWLDKVSKKSYYGKNPGINHFGAAGEIPGHAHKGTRMAYLNSRGCNMDIIAAQHGRNGGDLWEELEDEPNDQKNTITRTVQFSVKPEHSTCKSAGCSPGRARFSNERMGRTRVRELTSDFAEVRTI